MACGGISSDWQEKSVVESTESVHLLSELSVSCSQAGNQEVGSLKKVLRKDLGALDSTSIEESEVTLHPAAAAYIRYIGEPRTTPHPVSAANLGAIPKSPRAASSHSSTPHPVSATNLGAIPKSPRAALSNSSTGLSSQTGAVPPEAIPESAVPTNLKSDQFPAGPARPRFEEPRCGLLCRSDTIPVDNQNQIISVCNSCYRRVQTFARNLRITDLRDCCSSCCRETRVAVSPHIPQ